MLADLLDAIPLNPCITLADLPPTQHYSEGLRRLRSHPTPIWSPPRTSTCRYHVRTHNARARPRAKRARVRLGSPLLISSVSRLVTTGLGPKPRSSACIYPLFNPRSEQVLNSSLASQPLKSLYSLPGAAQNRVNPGSWALPQALGALDIPPK